MLSDDELKFKQMNVSPCTVDEVKLSNLLARRKTYGDIMQNATEAQLRYLMMVRQNDVPLVIKELQDWAVIKGSQTYIPPAFYERDGTFFQPPSFEMSNIKQYNTNGKNGLGFKAEIVS